MPFFMVDDDAPTNRKVKALTEPVLLAGDLTGVAALGLWSLAGATTQKRGADGVVTIADLVGILFDRTAATTLADRLVDAGLWHAPGHTCARCDPVPDHAWRFHDWADLRYKLAEDVRAGWAKSKENKRPEVVNAVWLRDCIDPTAPSTALRAECRYCGTVVKRADRTSATAPTIDHVDPRLAVGPRNLVVACGPCNRKKGARTPTDAGMVLRPAPRDLTPTAAALDADPTPTDTALAADASPGAPVAGAPADAPSVAAEGPSTGRPGSSTSARPEPSPSAKSVPAGTRAGQARGSGSGAGSGGRSDNGSDARGAASRSRRRRRGRGGRPTSPPPDPSEPPNLDAGPAPLAYPPPSGGSPWATWRGPRSPISDENRCAVHPDQHVPCPKSHAEEI